MIALKGAPGSPYTRKMLAVLRYRRIAYRMLFGNQPDTMGLPRAKVALLPTFYFESDNGEVEPMVDSTPIIRRLEVEYPGRSVIPTDPVMAFLDYLLEDYGDEWLTKAMFHYRWYYEADIKMAGEMLPYWSDITRPQKEIDELTRLFTDRQVGRLYVVGSNDQTAAVIEASYRRFLKLMTARLEADPFLLGRRPGASDFAVFGQLTQLTQFDPTPSHLAISEGQRVYAWVSLMEDQSGIEVAEDDWLQADQVPGSLTELLAELGRCYVPVMLANARAIDKGLDTVETRVDDTPWVQQPFPYQAKCLQWIRMEYARLDTDDRGRVDAILKDTGCEALFRANS
jgi:glutathione S-transferase